jgi:microcystin-dependent protein
MKKTTLFIVLVLVCAGLFTGFAQDEGITVINNGNVGINTTNPTEQLEVNGNVQINSDLILDGGKVVDKDANVRIEIKPDGEISINDNAGNNVVTITTNGSVAINQANPDAVADLDVGGEVKAASINTDTIKVNGAFYNHVPKGTIVMWNGTVPPPGWRLCIDGAGTYTDELNNTQMIPNLSGRFIVAYDPIDNDYDQPGTDIGGKKEHILTEAEMPSHFHTTTAKTNNSTHWDGEHQHKYDPHNRSPDAIAGNGYGVRGGNSADTTGESRHTHQFDIPALNTNSKGGGDPHENRPPYYTLAYIIYTGIE